MTGQMPSHTVTEYKNPQAEELYQTLFGYKGSLGKQLLSNASGNFKLLKGAREGDLEAMRKFYGSVPTEKTFAAMRGDTRQYGPPPVGDQVEKAANGGLMTLRRFAAGGKALTSDQVQFVSEMGKLASQGTELTQAQKDRLNKIETNTNKNVSPFTDTGTNEPGNAQVIKSMSSLNSYDKNVADRKQYDALTNKITPSDAYIKNPIGIDLNNTSNESFGITNPFYKEATTQLQNYKTPAAFSQAGDMYNAAGAGLLNAANYTPQQVAAQQASAQQASAASASAQQAQAAQMGQVADISAPEMQYFQADRGNIRDVEANKADTYGYDASTMQAPSDIAAQQAQTDKYAASSMQAPSDIAAQKYKAALAEANKMQGPGSWTDAGTASKYMNPYIQNVVDIEKRESNRDYQRQLNELSKQAVGAKAYGGSRYAIERAEATRNQAMKLADIEAQGLNQAYQQGMGQFTTEQGQSLQAGQANLTAAQQTALANQNSLNTQRQTYVSQALEAAKNNYGGELTKEQQNQVAQNAASQFNSQSQNTAYNNYVAQALQAAQNNYGGQLTAAQQNQVAQNAASQFYAQGQNQSSQAYAAQQLAAQQLNQGMDAATVQQNLQAMLGVQSQEAQQIMQAAVANQQTQFGVGSLNANLSNQTNLTNAQLGTQASLQNAQNATNVSMNNAQLGTQVGLANQSANLAAQTSNQSAGLAANSQKIGAYGATGNIASGLGSLGALEDTSFYNNLGAWNKAGATYQDLSTTARNDTIDTAKAMYGDAGASGTYGTLAGTPTGGVGKQLNNTGTGTPA